MTRESRDLYISRRSIDNQVKRFGNKEFYEEFLEAVTMFKEFQDIKMSEFVELMCKVGISQEKIELQSDRMDTRLALN